MAPAGRQTPVGTPAALSVGNGAPLLLVKSRPIVAGHAPPHAASAPVAKHASFWPPASIGTITRLPIAAIDGTRHAGSGTDGVPPPKSTENGWPAHAAPVAVSKHSSLLRAPVAPEPPS